MIELLLLPSIAVGFTNYLVLTFIRPVGIYFTCWTLSNFILLGLLLIEYMFYELIPSHS